MSVTDVMGSVPPASAGGSNAQGPVDPPAYAGGTDLIRRVEICTSKRTSEGERVWILKSLLTPFADNSADDRPTNRAQQDDWHIDFGNDCISEAEQ